MFTVDLSSDDQKDQRRRRKLCRRYGAMRGDQPATQPYEVLEAARAMNRGVEVLRWLTILIQLRVIDVVLSHLSPKARSEKPMPTVAIAERNKGLTKVAHTVSHSRVYQDDALIFFPQNRRIARS